MLAVEIIGATTVFLYGTNLLYDPVIEKPEEDPDHPGRPKVQLLYLQACLWDYNEPQACECAWLRPPFFTFLQTKGLLCSVF